MAATDRTLLVLGVSGLMLFLLAGLLLACPTVSQQRHLQIGIALAAASIGSAIPGFIIVNISVGASSAIRAGGALAVFFLVFWFNPASWADDRVDRAFSNASCQGWEPSGLHIPRSKIPASLDPSESGPIQSDQALGRPVRFTFNYQFEPFPGLRHWSQVRPGVWVEVYPDPSIVTVFVEIDRKMVDGCRGTVVTPKRGEDFRVFIPDNGCARMWARFQHGNQEWNWLGEMKDIE